MVIFISGELFCAHHFVDDEAFRMGLGLKKNYLNQPCLS